ncbi:unnamed protein product [Lepeophtheirus salmonis]|uniref:(salmon louse) hypothetical protein n=1 Tax=Lepeophtheirus salmonis TaxID=72036 RepID=A0A7R8CNK6_LEPSM|nr:unnamed protein product [Lepeophtheirus salmonis]CAF2876229.1 unnamed protein product [Lepeophtheirus salmonis]
MKRRDMKKRLEVLTSKVDSSRSSRTTQNDGEFQSISYLPIFFSYFDGKNVPCLLNTPPRTSKMTTTMSKVQYINKGTSVDIKTEEKFKNRFSIKNLKHNFPRVNEANPAEASSFRHSSFSLITKKISPQVCLQCPCSPDTIVIYRRYIPGLVKDKFKVIGVLMDGNLQNTTSRNSIRGFTAF